MADWSTDNLSGGRKPPRKDLIKKRREPDASNLCRIIPTRLIGIPDVIPFLLDKHDKIRYDKRISSLLNRRYRELGDEIKNSFD